MNTLSMLYRGSRIAVADVSFSVAIACMSAQYLCDFLHMINNGYMLLNVWCL